MVVHQFKQSHLDLSLVEEWLLVLDDLDGNMFLIYTVVCLHHLQTAIYNVITIRTSKNAKIINNVKDQASDNKQMINYTKNYLD